MKIAVLSDPHIGSSNPVFVPNWEKVVAHVNARNDIDLAIILGDLTLLGSEQPEDLRFGRAALDALNPSWLVLPGNHDVGDISRLSHQPANGERLSLWAEHYGPSYWYSDLLPGWRLIGLNSQIIGTGLTEEEAQWQALEDALATRGSREPVIFIHMPLFLNDWKEADRPAWALMSEGRTRLRRLINDHDVCAVVTGHMHRTIQFDIPETRMIWCAASSFLTYDQSMPEQPGAAMLGLTILTIADGAINAEFVEIDDLMVSRIEDYNGTIYRSPPKD
ncbi:3',5'-cyclic AMP phosphodiesterase CpdA [Pseudorhizobium tarimense]|uniref:3',5'-cyclic AMP phosphodiesterase CpdA n=1 Tax=Pseudorhizobium tarimense TaxID=1079109 RepID=A0ABV2HCV6_9HYPH|nr:metallophosphoesterase [Pseudorhizobium tarimense]MCJ8521422.1 metallophosphoesterase [Pseudorhizobium tarimense]